LRSWSSPYGVQLSVGANHILGTVLRLEGAAYVEAGHYRRGGTAASVLLAGLTVNVAAVFDAD
jgi:hypothetical protein